MKLCICLETCLSSRFMLIVLWLWMTYLMQMLSQNVCCGWGVWCHSLSFETFPVLISSLLIVKAMVFPMVMYGCESWTVRKAECQRIDAFELLCWRRLLRVPWTARRSNQSILKEISPGCSLEGLMLKLKLKYFGYLMRRVDSLEKTLMLGGLGAGGEGDGRGRDGWMASLTRWTGVWVNSGSRWWTGRPGVLRFMGSQRVGYDWATELNWTEQRCYWRKLNKKTSMYFFFLHMAWNKWCLESTWELENGRAVKSWSCFWS